jgi:streptogramin lyase
VNRAAPSKRAPGSRLLLAAAIIVTGCAATSPCSTPSNALASAASTVPVRPSASPASSKVPPRPSPTATPMPTPIESTVDGVAVRTLSLNDGSAPIDVSFAFGSIWVANHRRDSVSRIDPATMAIQATAKIRSGPGWFVVTDDALWVSNQNSHGMSRIDPRTNTTTIRAGDSETCGQGVFAFGSIWQPACAAHLIMRIDPTTFASTNVDSANHWSAIHIGDALITGGPPGLARLDPKTNLIAPIGGPDAGRLFGFDGKTIWASDDLEVRRIRPSDGAVTARLPIAEAGAVIFRKGRAWVTSSSGLVEVNLATNAIVRTLPIGQSVAVVNGGGALWVTSFDGNTLTSLRP